MLKMCILMMMMVTTLMSLIKTPMIMGFLLLIQTIMGCIITRLLMQSSWLSLTMFLMMVSGLMIIFMYVSSICSNSKLKINSMKPLIYIIPVIIYMMNFETNLMIMDNHQLKDYFNSEFMKLYSPMNTLTSLFMFIYLLMILIIMINLMTKPKGPLRKKY